MPAFTFEKISPPARRKPASIPDSNEKPRGAVVRLLERFTEVRVRRKLHAGADVSERRQPRDDT